MPKLERGKHWFDKLTPDLFKLDMHKEIFQISYDLLSDSEIRNYVIRNIMFGLPYFGKRMFLKDAQKIIPSLKLHEVSFAEGYGEVRPQVLDRIQKKLIMGEKRIRTGKGMTFNMTPSPGATSCLQNSMVDVQEIAEYLGVSFDKERFLRDLSPEELA